MDAEAGNGSWGSVGRCDGREQVCLFQPPRSVTTGAWRLPGDSSARRLPWRRTTGREAEGRGGEGRGDGTIFEVSVSVYVGVRTGCLELRSGIVSGRGLGVKAVGGCGIGIGCADRISNVGRCSRSVVGKWEEWNLASHLYHTVLLWSV